MRSLPALLVVLYIAFTCISASVVRGFVTFCTDGARGWGHDASPQRHCDKTRLALQQDATMQIVTLVPPHVANPCIENYVGHLR